MKLTKKRLKQIIKEEMNEMMAMLGGKPGMEKQDLIDDIVKKLAQLEQEEVAVIHKNIEEMINTSRPDPGRYQDPETGMDYPEDDPEHGYYPPGFLEENKNNAK